MKHKNTLNPKRYDQLMTISRDYLEAEIAELLSIQVFTLHQTLYRRKYSDLFKGHYKIGATTYFKNLVVKNFFNRNRSIETAPSVDLLADDQIRRIIGEKPLPKKSRKVESGMAYAQQ